MNKGVNEWNTASFTLLKENTGHIVPDSVHETGSSIRRIHFVGCVEGHTNIQTEWTAKCSQQQ